MVLTSFAYLKNIAWYLRKNEKNLLGKKSKILFWFYINLIFYFILFLYLFLYAQVKGVPNIL